MLRCMSNVIIGIEEEPDSGNELIIISKQRLSHLISSLSPCENGRRRRSTKPRRKIDQDMLQENTEENMATKRQL